MKIFGWSRGEHRAQTYTQARTEAGYAAAETAAVDASSLAIVETCVGLIAGPFMVCQVQGYPISLITLHTMARDALLCGNSVWAINTSSGALRLERASKFEVVGNSPDPDDWMYDLELKAPKATIKRRLPAASVVHIRLNPTASAPWVGKAPWQSASLTADAMANLERATKEEGNLAAGRIWTAPDGSSQGQLNAMAASIAALRGGYQVVAESTSQNFGQGAGRGSPAPAQDWKPNSTGPNFPQSNVLMRPQIEASIAGAYGIGGGVVSVNTSAGALGAIKRLAFLNKTLPLAALLAEELSEKLSSLTIGWDNLADQSVDIQLRGRAAAAVGELVTDKATLLRLVGLPMNPDGNGGTGNGNGNGTE